MEDSIEENSKSGIKKGAFTGFWGGLVASLCCVGPFIIILLGLGSVSFALSISQYRPYFLALGLLFMVSAIGLHLRKKSKTCGVNCFSTEGLKREKYFIVSVVLSMGVIYVLALYVLVPAVSPVVYGNVFSKTNPGSTTSLEKNVEEDSGFNGGELASGNLRQLDLKISGMTCAGCALGVEYGFKDLAGVVKAKVEYSSGTGSVIYDATKITKEKILEASSVYPTTIIDDKPLTEPIKTTEEEGEDIREVSDDDVHEFNIEAFQWGFKPSTIRVHKNGRVVLYLTSRDVVHGFALPEYDLIAKIEPGKTTPISFTASKKGEFTFYCSIPCGRGHNQMKGKLIVRSMISTSPTTTVRIVNPTTSTSTSTSSSTTSITTTTSVDPRFVGKRQATLKLEGMYCPSCAPAVSFSLKRKSGVISARVSYSDKKVVVVYNPDVITLDKLKSTIATWGPITVIEDTRLG